MKLNIGCGCLWLPGYVNVDREGHAQLCKWAAMDNKPLPVLGSADFQQLDLTMNWPWPMGCVEEILADNFLEHLTPIELTHLLREAWRVLKPGASMTGRVPDIERIFQYCKEKSQWEWFPAGATGPYSEPGMNALHNFCYGWGHQQVFTEEMLRERLEGAGFDVMVEQVEEQGLRFVAVKP